MGTDGTDLQTYVQQKVANGEFASAEEFTAEAIRVYRNLESGHEALRREVQRRIAQSDGGQSEPLDIDEIKAELATEVNDDGSPK